MINLNYLTAYEKRLLRKHKDRLRTPKKSIDNIIEYLNTYFHVRQIEKDTARYQHCTRIHYLNCQSMLEEINCPDKEINIIVYEISHSGYFDIFNPKYVYFEKGLDYIQSNNSDLSAEITIFRGLDRTDIETPTCELIGYLLTLEYLEKNNKL